MSSMPMPMPMPILDEEDHAELQRLDNHEGPLYALLKRRADLNLTGKVSRENDPCGHGGFSDIFIGYRKLANGLECKVAVKKLRAHIMEDRPFQKRLAKELYIWSKLKHPHILQLEGFYIENASYPHLISKWMENGTILKYLMKNHEADVLSLIIGIAEAIHYLHASKIVHSDIKPDNVLISDSGKPLLCDFGVSRLLAASESFKVTMTVSGGLSGTLQYMAREILRPESGGSTLHTEKSDVWAFGMTIYTLLTKQVPYQEIRNIPVVINVITNGSLPSWPEASKAWPFQNYVLQKMCEFCWEEKSNRPTMDIFIQELYHFKAESRRHSLGSIRPEYTFLYLQKASTSPVTTIATIVSGLANRLYSSLSLHRSPSPSSEDASRPSLQSVRQIAARKILCEAMNEPRIPAPRELFNPVIEVGERPVSVDQTRRVVLEALMLVATGARVGAGAYRSKAPLDLLIVLDSTASMGMYVESTKKSIVEIGSILCASGRLGQDDSLQVGLVAYRDYPEDENRFVVKAFPFTHDLEVMKSYLYSLEAHGGGDLPEAFSTALDYAYNDMEGWRDEALKAIIVVTDAAPHGIDEDMDDYPNGTPEGVTISDPLELARDMAEASYSIFTLVCEPTLSKNTKYAVDFYKALSDRTLGRFCSLTDHKMLPAYIFGVLLEKIELRELGLRYQEEITKDIFEDNTTVNGVVRKLHARLASQSQQVTNVQTGDIYNDDPDGDENYRTFIRSDSIARARPLLKEIGFARINYEHLMALQRSKREAERNEKEFFTVLVQFRNLGHRRIVLQIFDENLSTMHLDEVVPDGRIIQKQFKINVPVNFSVTLGRMTKNFSKVFVNDATIDLDAYFD